MKQLNRFFAWLEERSVWQIGLSYLVGAWVILQVVIDLSEVAGLPPWIGQLVLAALVAGLAGVLATAIAQRSSRIRRGRAPSASRLRLLRILTWRNVLTAGVTVFALIGLAATVSFTIGRVRPGATGLSVGGTSTDFARLLRLAANGRTSEAYVLAASIERETPSHPLLEDVWPRIARYTGVRTDPPGARVEIRPYGDPGAEWIELGTTPLDPVLIPVGFLRWRITLAGYEPVELASSGAEFPDLRLHVGLPLRPVDERSADMVFVTGGEVRLDVPGLADAPSVQLGDFLIDRYEVTNAAYQAFVDSGGYHRPEYWQQSFVRDGSRIAFEEAMSAFTDLTGQPGPATWTSGRYPPDTGELPVGGISWYEAEAYARFAGKELPTVHHWRRAADASLAAHITPLSNFSSSAPAAAGAHEGMSPFGSFDMAGNVREWCWNETTRGRYIAGGSWEDASYLFREIDLRSPWDRSAGNGVRAVRQLEPSTPSGLAYARLEARSSNIETEPVPPAVFEAYAAQYAYDRTPLDATVEERSAGDGWRRELVSFRAAYGDERMLAVLWLPTTARPPYQTVVVFPGSNSLGETPVLQSHFAGIEFIVRSGRAVMLPVYKGTHERYTGVMDDNPDTTAAYRDHVVMWSKDLGRSIDYLETRADIDAERIAYYGLSWGAGMGAIMAALEPRLRTLILRAGGLWNLPVRAEADQRTFAVRVTVPVLMLNGRHDPFFPYATAQAPLLAMLGTPAAQKRHVVYEGAGHTVPRLDADGETLAWLDRFLGRVQ